MRKFFWGCLQRLFVRPAPQPVPPVELPSPAVSFFVHRYIIVQTALGPERLVNSKRTVLQKRTLYLSHKAAWLTQPTFKEFEPLENCSTLGWTEMRSKACEFFDHGTPNRFCNEYLKNSPNKIVIVQFTAPITIKGPQNETTSENSHEKIPGRGKET